MSKCIPSAVDKHDWSTNEIEILLNFIKLKGGDRISWGKKSQDEIAQEAARLCNVETAKIEEEKKNTSLMSVSLGTKDTVDGLETSVVASSASEMSLTQNKTEGNEELPEKVQKEVRTIVRNNKKVAWNELFANNRNPSSCGEIPAFASDGPIVDIPEVDLLESSGICNKHLVGYFTNNHPGKAALNRLLRSWNVPVQLMNHDKGWIIFKFEKEEDLSKVIQEGPYSIYGRSLLLKKMPKFFQFDHVQRSTIPIWVQLRALPMELWTPAALGRICSNIGFPLLSDKLTTNRDRLSFARVLVEVDIAKQLKHNIQVRLPGNIIIDQEVFYENVPRYCNRCKVFGHTDGQCPHVKYIPKNKSANAGTENVVSNALDSAPASAKGAHGPRLEQAAVVLESPTEPQEVKGSTCENKVTKESEVGSGPIQGDANKVKTVSEIPAKSGTALRSAGNDGDPTERNKRDDQTGNIEHPGSAQQGSALLKVKEKTSCNQNNSDANDGFTQVKSKNKGRKVYITQDRKGGSSHHPNPG